METNPEVLGALLRKKRAKHRFHTLKSSLTRTAKKGWEKPTKEAVPELRFRLSKPACNAYNC